MRCLTLEIPADLVRDAQLYGPQTNPLDSVLYVLEDYPRLVAELRQLRRRLADFNRESCDLDQRLEALQVLCRQILDL